MKISIQTKEIPSEIKQLILFNPNRKSLHQVKCWRSHGVTWRRESVKISSFRPIQKTITVWVIGTVAHPKAYDSFFLRGWFYRVAIYHGVKIFSFISLSIKSLFIFVFWANFRLRIRANFGLSFSHFRQIILLEFTKTWLIIQ